MKLSQSDVYYTKNIPGAVFMIKSKHLLIARNPRRTNFPYRVQSVGYVFDNPRLSNMKFTFPDKIEFCIRTLSYGETGSTARMTLENKKYEVNYPHVLIKMPNSSYEYEYLDGRDVFFFTYSKELYPLLKPLGLFDDALAWNIELTPDVNRLLGQLHEYLEKSRNFGVTDRIDLICFQLLSEFLIQKHSQTLNPDPEMEQILQIDSYLRIHYTEDINMDKLALQHGMSRTSFFRKWSKFFKETPAKQLLQLRLQEAARQLIESHYRINEIAQQVNIPDPAYFCAVFRKHYGLTPADYREQKRSSHSVSVNKIPNSF